MAGQGVSKLVAALPISGYPVSRRFRHRSTVAFLAVCAILVYCALTVFNVITQGKNKINISLLKNNYYTDKETKCSARTINVGDSVFSSPAGVLRWSVTGIQKPSGSDSSFTYSGTDLAANITFVSLTYNFPGQSYIYEVCANASLTTNSSIVDSSDQDFSDTLTGPRTVLSMCTTYDPTRDAQPDHAAGTQTQIEDTVYGISSYLPLLNFASGSIPSVRFPPYGAPGNSPADMNVNPNRAFDLSIWLDGIAYLPTVVHAPDNWDSKSFGDVHETVLVSQPNQVVDMSTAFEETVKANVSGIMLMLNGIGGLQLMTQSQNSAIGFTEPGTITDMRSYALNAINRIMDSALTDLNGRSIQSSYLCTFTSYEWKPVGSMVAMILGNNSALFGFFLGVLVTLAQFHE